MRLYHTSYMIIESPDVKFSRKYLDFGEGFYLTAIKEQAIKYAERFILRGKRAFLNEYELNDNLEAFNVLKFDLYDGKWLDYVSKCRKNLPVEYYDVIIGGVADDKVFRTIDLYFAGEMSKEDALKRLKYEKPNNQFCIRTQDVIEKNLVFIKSEEVSYG